MSQLIQHVYSHNEVMNLYAIYLEFIRVIQGKSKISNDLLIELAPIMSKYSEGNESFTVDTSSPYTFKVSRLIDGEYVTIFTIVCDKKRAHVEKNI